MEKSFGNIFLKFFYMFWLEVGKDIFKVILEVIMKGFMYFGNKLLLFCFFRIFFMSIGFIFYFV